MRFLRLNCREFETPEGEEEITFHQSHMRCFADIAAFISGTDKDLSWVAERPTELPDPCYLAETSKSAQLMSFLSSETDLILRNDSLVYVLHDEWNEVDIAFQCLHYFCRYRWSTTA